MIEVQKYFKQAFDFELQFNGCDGVKTGSNINNTHYAFNTLRFTIGTVAMNKEEF